MSQVLLELSYPEILSVGSTKSGRLFDQTITFVTLRQEQFGFKCAHSEDIRDVVDFFLAGLKARSKYAVGTENYSPAGGEGGGMKKGDLVRMAYDQTGDSLLRSLL